MSPIVTQSRLFHVLHRASPLAIQKRFSTRESIHRYVEPDKFKKHMPAAPDHYYYRKYVLPSDSCFGLNQKAYDLDPLQRISSDEQKNAVKKNDFVLFNQHNYTPFQSERVHKNTLIKSGVTIHLHRNEVYKDVFGNLGSKELMSLFVSRKSERRDKKNEQEGHGSFEFKPFYAMLGLLGVFRSPTSGEIEEGRAQLTDEEKMKKMKPIELKIAKGVLSMCDQDYIKANQFFHDALQMAQDDNDEEQENLILNLMASNYFEKGDFQNAELLFIDLMKRMIAHNIAPTEPPILELSLKLASIYSKNPTTQDKALKGFKFVISSLLSNLEDIVNDIEELDIQTLSAEKKDELALLGWSYDWFAKHLLAMNDYKAAADMLQRAFQISSLVLGPLHDQTLILLNDIGTTLAMNDAPEEGEKFIKKAVEGAITNQSKELASFYVNLGLVNLKLRKLHEAKRYCEYSMELAKKNREHYNTQEVIALSRTCSNEAQRLLDAERQ